MLMVVLLTFYRAPDSWAWGNWTRDDLWLVDASFVKLRQVRLGYNFDSDKLSNTPFTGIDIASNRNKLSHPF